MAVLVWWFLRPDPWRGGVKLRGKRAQIVGHLGSGQLLDGLDLGHEVSIAGTGVRPMEVPPAHAWRCWPNGHEPRRNVGFVIGQTFSRERVRAWSQPTGRADRFVPR